MKTKFITEYPVGSDFYSSYVFADDLENAKEVCRRRNIGEVVIGTTDNIESNKDLDMKDVLHEVIFLSYIGLKSNTISLEETLGDKGIVHEVSHFFCDNKNIQKKELIKKIEWLRKIIIGYEPL